MSELKRYDVLKFFLNANVEIADGEYYLADDVDKRIEELKQRIKELADNLEEAEDLHAEWKNEVAPKISELKQRIKELEQALEKAIYLLKGYKAQMHSFKLSEVIDEHIVTNEQLLKGGE